MDGVSLSQSKRLVELTEPFDSTLLNTRTKLTAKLYSEQFLCVKIEQELCSIERRNICASKFHKIWWALTSTVCFCQQCRNKGHYASRCPELGFGIPAQWLVSGHVHDGDAQVTWLLKASSLFIALRGRFSRVCSFCSINVARPCRRCICLYPARWLNECNCQVATLWKQVKGGHGQLLTCKHAFGLTGNRLTLRLISIVSNMGLQTTARETISSDRKDILSRMKK